MNLLIKSATIVDRKSLFHLKSKDILIKNGIISDIKDQIEEENAILVDLPNLHVSKGWFDSSVCFGEPGFEERETIANGLDVCQKSGFTGIVINPNTQHYTHSHQILSKLLYINENISDKIPSKLRVKLIVKNFRT